MGKSIREDYKAMIEILEDFEDKKILIDVLIAKLENSIDTIPNGDEIWKENIVQNWATLEMSRALALFEERSYLNQHETQLVFEAVAELKRLVLERLGHAKC